MSWRSREVRWRTLHSAFLVLFSASALAQTPTPGDATPVVSAQPSEAAPASDTKAPTATAPQDNVPVVKLGAGDLVEVSVFGVPDLATKSRIDNGGDIYLPLVDYVHIAGLTTDEAQELIQKRFADGGFVRNPHVTVLVDESASQAVTMLGEVGHPGPYPVIGERRLYDMIASAGGLTNAASRHLTIVHRENPDKKIEIVLPPNLNEDMSSNVIVQPGDTIVVGRAGVVYVIGDVQHPSGFMLDTEGLTALKALALAGGQTKTSALDKSRLLRKSGPNIQEIPVQLKKVLHAKAPDVAMLKGDILFIPGSGAKSFAYRAADAAFTMSTALAVVAVHP